eukprot:CAMPEP_0197009954 /NCGR_PEP_ID=MMETSP1380-20130617/52204_1 /TAXON_ID=5936 /ORGANISM="Euplotes crassus, Strain CT5" /LENGTH=155 /DNA_ID=CAMNT_0042431553 /DNA_START=17 /DNA_END=481 /DNA_ORIENTATION=+
MEPDDPDYKYGVEDYDLIYPNVYHSAYHTAYNKDKLEELGITHILSLGNEFEEEFKDSYTYKIFGLDDDEDNDVKQFFKEGIAFIEKCLQDKGTILVHCAAGISRSGAMMTAYSMYRDKVTFEEALEYVQSKRKKVFPNEGFREQLQEFEEELKD